MHTPNLTPSYFICLWVNPEGQTVQPTRRYGTKHPTKQPTSGKLLAWPPPLHPPIPRPPHPPKRKKTTLFRPHSLAEAGVVAGVRVGSRVMNVSCLSQTSRPLFHWELYRHGTSLQEQCYFSTPSFHLLFVSEALLHPMHWPQSLSMPSSANLEHWLSLWSRLPEAVNPLIKNLYLSGP